MKTTFFITFMIFLLFFSGPLFCISVNTELGLGNFISLCVAYNNIGVGSGYLNYTDDENDVKLNIVTPFIMYSKDIADIFIIRGRFGIDLISENGSSYQHKSYLLAPDFLVKIFSFKTSCLYVGVSVPATIGKEGVGIESVIGSGYSITF